MTRNKYILLGAFVLVILGVAFVSQIRKLQRQLRSSVRIIPSESKSREDTIRNGVDEGLSSGRPELLVKFRFGTSEQRIGEITNRLNDRVRDEIEAVPGLTVIDDPDDADPAALAASYQAVPEVEYAEPNYEVTLDWLNDSGVNDPRYAEQRWLVEINAPDAWAITKGSDQIVVAVLDSGVEYTHADLRNNMWTATRRNRSVSGSRSWDHRRSAWLQRRHERWRTARRERTWYKLRGNHRRRVWQQTRNLRRQLEDENHAAEIR